MGGMAERWDVTSGDGGSIAVWVDGAGPQLVPVHGSVSDHNVFATSPPRPWWASCETNSLS